MMSPGELIKALDELAVGLVMVGCQLGEKLVVRNAGRRGQASLVEDAGADFRRRRGRRSTVLVLVGRDLRMLAHCGASPNCVERLSATLITGAADSRKRPPTNEAAATGRSANLKYRSPVGQALGQAILIYLVIASSPVTAQDARPGRETFAEMVAFARVGSVACQRLAPDVEGFHALALQRLIKPPLAEKEIVAKEKEVKSLRDRLGLSRWCRLYAGEMEQARILVQVLRRQN